MRCQGGGGGGGGAGARRASDFVVLLILVSLLLVQVPCSNACFRSLRRPSYETYWLGTYYDSRLISLTCFALRSFRWTLKLVKVTYENWHIEMQYAKCISETYGMNIPFYTPPWKKNARMLLDNKETRSSLPFRGSPRQLSYSMHRWDEKHDINEIITSLKPVLEGNNKVSEQNFFLPNENESLKEIVRIAKSLYQIFFSVLNEIEIVFARTLGSGILSCTQKYMHNAFWRWVDSAPFLK